MSDAQRWEMACTMESDDLGGWVRYEDYDRLRKRAEKAERHANRLAGALANGINPATGMTKEWYADCVTALAAYREAFPADNTTPRKPA